MSKENPHPDSLRMEGNWEYVVVLVPPERGSREFIREVKGCNPRPTPCSLVSTVYSVPSERGRDLEEYCVPRPTRPASVPLSHWVSRTVRKDVLAGGRAVEALNKRCVEFEGSRKNTSDQGT